MKEDTIKDIINDARDVAKDTDGLSQLGIEDIVNRLEKLVEHGLYITPTSSGVKECGSEGVGLAGLKRFYSMPELGITFNRVASPKCVRLTAFFRSVPKPGCGKPDKNCDHVYEVRIDRDMSVSPPLWVARAYVDGTMSFTVFAVGRWKCELLALSAFKGYLHRVLRKSRRNIAEKGGKAKI